MEEEKFLTCQLLQMELGNRKWKAEAAEPPAYPGFMTWDFCSPLKPPKACAEDLLRRVTSEERSEPGIEGKSCDLCQQNCLMRL